MNKPNPDKITPENELMYARKDVHAKEIEKHLERIAHEFKNGFEFVSRYPKSITIFGSSIASQESEYCKKARELGERIVRVLGYAVITGGGGGVMEAASRGVFEAGGTSVGMNISLPHERQQNPYLSDEIKFSYFFSRKTMMAFAAEAYVFFPGGYGTMDEIFGILTLLQTGKIPRVPVILFDSKFWNPFKDLMRKVLDEQYRTIAPGDVDLFEITDSLDHVIEVIQKAPVSEWWRNIS